jgi:hypothetical protein
VASGKEEATIPFFDSLDLPSSVGINDDSIKIGFAMGSSG